MSLPFQPPLAPMEAATIEEIPKKGEWQFEPKWDGFRCLVFKDGAQVHLQSKAGQPLGRYFPDLTAAIGALRPKQFVLDGEIAVPVEGRLCFDELLLRIHPAASRVAKLASAHPAIYVVFDLLVNDKGQSLVEWPLAKRRPALERFAGSFLARLPAFRLSPATRDPRLAQEWFKTAGGDLDGIVAKRLDVGYRSGERTGMVKVKPNRTVDCVVGGFRYAAKQKVVGSLLLGLYDQAGLLHHVGFCSGLKTEQRKSLLPILTARIESPGFTGHAPGGPSRWSTERSTAWEPLRPDLVVEVAYDHFTGGRFRHGTQFIRWRPDKAPKQCRMDQIARGGTGAYELLSRP